MSKGSGGQRDEMGLKRFQQVKIFFCVVSFLERRQKLFGRVQNIMRVFKLPLKKIFFFEVEMAKKKKRMCHM